VLIQQRGLWAFFAGMLIFILFFVLFISWDSCKHCSCKQSEHARAASPPPKFEVGQLEFVEEVRGAPGALFRPHTLTRSD
jgi:hypothetical protein